MPHLKATRLSWNLSVMIFAVSGRRQLVWEQFSLGARILCSSPHPSKPFSGVLISIAEPSGYVRVDALPTLRIKKFVTHGFVGFSAHPSLRESETICAS